MEDAMRISVVLLAAGQSSRMQGRNKLLLDFGGESLVRRTARTAVSLQPEELIVVTGHARAQVEASLAALPLRFVFNPLHESGQPSSVAAGVAALTVWCDAVMILPSDLPLIEADDLRFLCNAYRSMDEGSIAVPFFLGTRGNPVIFSSSHIPEVISGRTNIGCRKLIDNNPELVTQIEATNDHYIVDLDTSDAYEAALQRLKTAEWLDA